MARRQSKYLNNLVEQDHRYIKRLIKLGMGFFSFKTAWRTLQGYETMNMLRKGQISSIEKRESMKQVAFIASLFNAKSNSTNNNDARRQLSNLYARLTEGFETSDLQAARLLLAQL
jgi:DDE domain